MIRGITVILHEKTKVGIDAFNAPIYSEDLVAVDNVLVAPASTNAEADILHLDGKVAVYTLGIPKGDAHKWEDSIVEFFGEKWHTIGYATEGIDELIPTQWNKKVQVERHG